MNVSEYIKDLTFKQIGLKKQAHTPNSDRLTYINDDELIWLYNIRAYRTWYSGDANELLNFYTCEQTFGWASNPIYNRNNVNMFWGKSSTECNIKRIHSGFAKAMIDTLNNIVGLPTITTTDLRLEKIFKINDFKYKLSNQLRTMALVECDGCLKLNINPLLANVPLFEYYGAEDWEPITKSGILLGLIFKTYYKDEKGNDYILFESRRLVQGGCLIDYDLFRLDKKNNLFRVDFDAVPELAGLNLEAQLIPNVKRLFARPLIYYYNPIRPDRGKSLYDGVIDQLDFLDEVWSQASQTNRVSTPVEYYNVDILERTKKGRPVLPQLYNRQFVESPGDTDSDGMSGNKGIETTQPDLNFEKYASLADDIKLDILVGRLSPSSLGMNISKKDNAEAEREKEKQSIFTRNNIIERETSFLEGVCEDALLLQDYIDTGVIGEKAYDISIKYDEFANPSFESELQTLGPAWTQGQISTEDYVHLLWAGKKSDEEMLKTIEWLDQNRQKDDIDLEGLLNNETRANPDLLEQGQSEAGTAEDQE